MTVQRNHHTYLVCRAVLLSVRSAGRRATGPGADARAAPGIGWSGGVVALALLVWLVIPGRVAIGQTADSTEADRTEVLRLSHSVPAASLPLLDPGGPGATSESAPSFPLRLEAPGGTDTTAAEAAGRSRRASWDLRIGGAPAAWPEGAAPTASPEDVERVARTVLSSLRRDGYYYARIDSAVVRRSSVPPRVRLHATRGPQVVVDRVELTGNESVPEARLRRSMDLQAGQVLQPGELKSALDAMLQVYEEAGYPLAEIRMAEMRLRRTSPARLAVTLQVTEGPALWLRSITLPDAARTSPSLVAHLAGLQIGEPLTGYDPSDIRDRLQAADFFASVGSPELRVDSTGGAVLHVPVDERDPGSFDLALGYLPPSRGNGGGQVVGNGHLSLRNLFGGGRTADLQLDRRPGQASLFDLAVADPYLFGWPLQVEGRFRGEQRDSTFSERMYRMGIGYRFDGGLDVTGTLTREVTRPGQAGAQIRDGRQRIPRSEALFYGVRLGFRRVDDPRNPRRGGSLTVDLEQGTKERRFFERTASTDTTRRRETLRQERIEGRARVYIPLMSRQVLAAGVDASVLLSPSYDRSDLFQLGGARSLRGYNEDRFLGSSVGRLLLEYRLQIDRVSYAYAFGDLGYVERPALGSSEASTDVHPGYGIGIQFGTAIGVVETSYALQPADPSPASGRVHLRLSFDL